MNKKYVDYIIYGVLGIVFIFSLTLIFSSDKGSTSNNANNKVVEELVLDTPNLTVKVGEVAHPMDDDHFIQFLVVGVGAEQYAKCFKPGDVAEATFTVNSAADVKALAFCNLHGLWSSE